MCCRIRTSSGAFLKRGQDGLIQQIEAKIAKFSGIPAENGEGLQILDYEASEKYEAHFDYFHDQINQIDGGQRLATMLMYLSDVEEGGETVFPSSKQKPVSPNSSISEVLIPADRLTLASIAESTAGFFVTPKSFKHASFESQSSMTCMMLQTTLVLLQVMRSPSGLQVQNNSQAAASCQE